MCLWLHTSLFPQSKQPMEETHHKMVILDFFREEIHHKAVISDFPRAKTQSLSFPKGHMAFFGTCQTIENIGNKIFLN